MIVKLLIYFNMLLLIGISGLHFYWAAGGKWGLKAAIPAVFWERYSDPKNKLVGVISTLVIAFGLLVFAGIQYFHLINFADPEMQRWSRILTRVIGSIFILRSIGDFNMFGMFKKKSATQFSVKDSQIYVPLSLVLGISSFLISYFS